MTLTIDLSPSQERRLTVRASQQGCKPTDLATQLLVESLADAEAEDAWAAEVIARWEASDQQTISANTAWAHLGL